MFVWESPQSRHPPDGSKPTGLPLRAKPAPIPPYTVHPLTACEPLCERESRRLERHSYRTSTYPSRTVTNRHPLLARLMASGFLSLSLLGLIIILIGFVFGGPACPLICHPGSGCTPCRTSTYGEFAVLLTGIGLLVAGPVLLLVTAGIRSDWRSRPF